MTFISSPYNSVGLELADICKPWTASLNDGTDKRMMNRAQALVRLAQVLNHCLGHYPRVVMAMNMQQAIAEGVGADPLYEWYYDDQVTNGRNTTTSLIIHPREAGAGTDCEAGRYTGGAVTESTSILNTTATTVTLYDDMMEANYPHARGNAAAAEITEALSTFNGYTVTGFSVQDDELSTLDSSIHDHVVPELAKRGAEVLDDLLEEVRDKLHDLETKNLSKFISWSAQRLAAGWQTVAAGTSDETGCATSSASFVNLIDQSVTARSATSPGMSCHVRNRGWGAQDEANGKLIKVMCRVNSVCAGGSLHGVVRFHGPSFTAGGGANNYCDIPVTNGAAQAWNGGASDFVYLDASAADGDTTTGRNKIDVLFKIDGAVTTEKLSVYGLSAWQHAPAY